jgi:hypothetical protein
LLFLDNFLCFRLVGAEGAGLLREWLVSTPHYCYIAIKFAKTAIK